MSATFVGMPAFPAAAREALADTQLRRNLAHATGTIRAKRAAVVGEVAEWEELRLAGAAIKDNTLRRLDEHLLTLEAALQAGGATVHWARDAQEACDMGRADFGFEPADLLGQRRLADEELGGGPPEVQFVGDGDEVPHQPEVEVHAGLPARRGVRQCANDATAAIDSYTTGLGRRGRGSCWLRESSHQLEDPMADPGTPVVFIHGLWLHATSWTPWIDHFRAAGYAPIAPGWPHEPETVEQARANPDAVADISIDDATGHYASIIEGLERPPVIIGHSFGGLITEKLLGQGIGLAGVAIDPAQIKGVLPLPLAQLRAGLPALGNPANLHRAVSLTEKEFRFGFGNALTDEESSELYRRWTIPSPARPLFQAAAANFVMHSQAKVDTHREDRGPLLLISGTADHTVPDVVTRSTLKQYRDSTAVTELKQFEGRGHSLTVDSGWREVADSVLGWLREHGI